MKTLPTLLLLALALACASAGSAQGRPPIIDMHLHTGVEPAGE